MRLYSIYDEKAEAFAPPFVAHNDMLALRTFEGTVNNDDFPLKKYPSDFHLYYLGSVGDVDGRFYIDSPDDGMIPKRIGSALDYVIPDKVE